MLHRQGTVIPGQDFMNAKKGGADRPPPFSKAALRGCPARLGLSLSLWCKDPSVGTHGSPGKGPSSLPPPPPAGKEVRNSPARRDPAQAKRIFSSLLNPPSVGLLFSQVAREMKDSMLPHPHPQHLHPCVWGRGWHWADPPRAPLGTGENSAQAGGCHGVNQLSLHSPPLPPQGGRDHRDSGLAGFRPKEFLTSITKLQYLQIIFL